MRIIFDVVVEKFTTITSRVVRCAIIVLIFNKEEIVLRSYLTLIISFFFVSSAFGLGGTAGTSIYSNFKAKSTGENSSLNIVMGSLSHKVSDFTLNIGTSATKNLNDEYSSYEVGNTSFSASHLINVEDVFSFRSTYKTIFATSKFSRDIQNMRAGLGHSFSLPIKMTDKTSLVVNLSNNIYLYEYETDINGNSNTLHQHTFGASIGHQFNKWLSSGISISGTKNFTHNNVATDSYVLAASLTAAWNKLYFGLGYEKFDSFLDPSGRSSNISVFDLDASMFNLSISTSF